jgi:hypothetical protein
MYIFIFAGFAVSKILAVISQTELAYNMGRRGHFLFAFSSITVKQI